MSALIQRNLSGGEITQDLDARVDTVKYATGMRTFRNSIVRRHGGSQNRPGTQFIAETKDSSKKTILIPIKFSRDRNYMLEFGDRSMRVIHGDAYVRDSAKTITGITQASQAVVTSAAHGYSNGDEVFIDAIVGMIELNGRNLLVSDVATNTFKLKYLDGTYVDSSAFTAYGSAGTAERIYTLITPLPDETPYGLLKPQFITAFTNANPGVVTIPFHGYSNGDVIYIYGCGGMLQINGRYVEVANKTDNTFEIKEVGGANINTTAYGVYVANTGTGQFRYALTTALSNRLRSYQFAKSISDDGFRLNRLVGVGPYVHPVDLFQSGFGHGGWEVRTKKFSPGIPPVTNLVTDDSPGLIEEWYVTAIAEGTFEESLVASITNDLSATDVHPVTLTWTGSQYPVGTPAYGYNIYKLKNGLHGFIGFTQTTTYIDNGIVADINVRPTDYLAATTPILVQSKWPSAVANIQQRLALAGPLADPASILLSAPATPYYFPDSHPSLDSDKIKTSVMGGIVKYIIEVGKTIVFTEDDERVMAGNSEEVLTPTSAAPKVYSGFGSGDVPPLLMDGNVLFIQQGNNIIRDFGFDMNSDGYRGNDLTTFASHLFEGYEIVAWAFQKNPNYIVWAVRNDGVLLGFTYVREHQIWAWHRHDTDGLVEDVAVRRDGATDSVFLVIKRTIDGVTKRYVEKMASRYYSDIVDAIFMDSSLSYDGRNETTAHTMTLSGGTLWVYTETLTLTSSASYFVAGDVGNAIHIDLVNSEGIVTDTIRFAIEGYSSATVVTGKAHKTVPVGLRAAAVNDWAKAVDVVGGLWHLEGKDVSILADGFVIASPNNEAYDVYTVTDGEIELTRPYAVIHVGLPYISDLQTLNLETATGETMVNKHKLVSEVTLQVKDSRGIWAGPLPPTDDDVDPLEGLSEYKPEDTNDLDAPVAEVTDAIAVKIDAQSNNNGRVFIRQVDPLPIAVNSITPTGYIPLGK